MVIFPRAKINIGLYVTDKRPDGFHNIETLFYPIGLADVLEAIVDESVPEGAFEMSVTGLVVEGSPGDNLVARAIRLLAGQYRLPGLRVHLHKCIPMGAGLGGGSSDASGMVLLLNRLLKLGLTNEEMAGIALDLGSDCPFFIRQTPSFARGRGELLTEAPVSLKGLHLQLYHPGTGISTAMAYRHVKTGQPGVPIEKMAAMPVEQWKGLVENVFEPYAFEQLPVVGHILEELYRHGALYASMTGSGSAVYGLFEAGREAPPAISAYLIWQEVLSR
jgi:4-diphosphocytidyl-2-C-methyl-D-erythritol kinase